MDWYDTGYSVDQFLSTPSAGRATWAAENNDAALPISIHALRGEGDGQYVAAVYPLKTFLSTPSAGRATAGRGVIIYSEAFLSTPSAGRATQRSSRSQTAPIDFYPRPPRGGRPCLSGANACTSKFLSTPSAGRATGDHNAKIDNV